MHSTSRLYLTARRLFRALRSGRKWLERAAESEGPASHAPLCVLPWTHSHIQTIGEVELCCLTAGRKPEPLGNINTESILKIFASPAYNRVRTQMINGEWPEACHTCQQRETMGLPSYRQWSNQKHPERFRQLLTKPGGVVPEIRSMDLRLNNVCNFKCRTCHGIASNRWFSEHNLIYPEMQISKSMQGFDHLQSFWIDFDRHILPGLEEIHLAGGEPLLSQGQYLLLEKLISAGKTGIRLRYDTNVSNLKFMHWDAVELWKNFPNLELSLSLDGVGEQGEYIRDGLDYQKWSENVDRLNRELPHATRTLHFVVSIFNVQELRRHYETIVKNEFVRPELITFTFLDWPPFLSVQVLRPELKANVVKDLIDWIAEGRLPSPVKAQIEALTRYIGQLDLYGLHGADFADKTKTLDRLRGQNALALFPGLETMLYQ